MGEGKKKKKRERYGTGKRVEVEEEEEKEREMMMEKSGACMIDDVLLSLSLQGFSVFRFSFCFNPSL